MTQSLTWRTTDLRRLWPHAPQTLVDGINSTKDAILPKYGITNRNRIIQFMGVCSEETGAGMRLEEDLRYSGARMWELWGTHRFHSLAEANKAAAGGVQAIAEAIYGHRADLGNTQPGDGYKFRGEGAIQVTGRGNFTNLAKWTGLDLLSHPELAADPQHCLEVAAAYWMHAGCNELADTGSVTAVTRRVNGGLINLPARVNWVASWGHLALVPLAAPVPAPVERIAHSPADDFSRGVRAAVDGMRAAA